MLLFLTLSLALISYTISSLANQTTDMSEIVAIIGDSSVNRHLDSAKSANPSLLCLRQSHLIPAFNAMELETAVSSQNEHRKILCYALHIAKYS